MKVVSKDSAEDPPSLTITPALDEMPRAGTVAEQIALQDTAYEMVETYKAPSGYMGARLSNAWLGEHDWNVCLHIHDDLAWEGDTIRAFMAAVLRRGHAVLYGTAVSQDMRPSAVWRIPVEEDAIQRFFEAHGMNFSVLFPADRSFAVQGNDGDFAVFAGPESFLREALPDEAFTPAFLAKVVDRVEAEHGEGCMEGVLAHYAPFMLGR
jgi:hypothetical protein